MSARSRGTLYSATPLFQMQAQIMVPQCLSFSERGKNLDHLAHELGVDIDMRPGAG